MSRPHQLKSDRGHRYNLVTPTAYANPCTIIPKPTPSEDEGCTMGGLGLGFKEEKEGTVTYVGGMRDTRSSTLFNDN